MMIAACIVGYVFTGIMSFVCVIELSKERISMEDAAGLCVLFTFFWPAILPIMGIASGFSKFIKASNERKRSRGY